MTSYHTGKSGRICPSPTLRTFSTTLPLNSSPRKPKNNKICINYTNFLDIALKLGKNLRESVHLACF